MKTLTLSMIVKNEEANLPRVLSTISTICDEIIVVDTGSVDKTVEIARSFGADVRFMEWENDFAKARNLSIKDAKSDWILWLDGDDFVPEESLPYIKELVQREGDCVYAFTVKNERPDGTGTEFLQARLFPNHKGLLFERPVHEQVMLSALRKGLAMVPSKAFVEHHGYADPEEMKVKAERNVKILEANLEQYGNDPVTFVEIGDSYSIMEDRDLADTWYRKTVELPNAETQFPDVVSQAWMGLGNSANIQKRYTEAERCFSKVVELCPGRIDLFYNLAVTYERQGDLDKAVKVLERIFTTEATKVKVGVDIRQARIRGAMKMMRLLLRGEKFDELNQKSEFLKQVLPDRLEIDNAIGCVYYRQGELTAALKQFEKTIRELPEGNVDAFIGLSLIYISAGRDELALEMVQNGLEAIGENCRFQLFVSLFNNDVSFLDSFTAEKVASEVSYLEDMFGLHFEDTAIVEVVLTVQE